MTCSLGDTVAAEVRAEMGRQRKEQKDLAEALGVTQATISRRLSGERPFSLNDLERLAAYFGVPLASLIRERAA